MYKSWVLFQYTKSNEFFLLFYSMDVVYVFISQWVKILKLPLIKLFAPPILRTHLIKFSMHFISLKLLFKVYAKGILKIKAMTWNLRTWQVYAYQEEISLLLERLLYSTLLAMIWRLIHHIPTAFLSVRLQLSLIV